MSITINHQDLLGMFRCGAINLDINKAYVDSLNVFPVPDGDTGTNMNLTMVSTIREIDAVKTNLTADILQSFARGALKGARGNSGVILSQIFKGIANSLISAPILNTKAFAKSLKNGSDIAYDAVTYPKEGTILTVIRVIGEYAIKIAPRTPDFIDFFRAILKKGEEILAATPDMLPILKKAGVVDAGGKGLLIILYGMYNSLAGIEMKPLDPERAVSPVQVNFEADVHDFGNIEFAYCTEFFIINLKNSATLADIDILRDKLNKIGDCVIVVGDLQLVKIHVHTNSPDKALGYALSLGELDKLKVENMLEQNRQFMAQRKTKKIKPVGMVSICAGQGMRELFKELLVDAVLEGGQTMNPSVSDIVEIVDSVGAETVFILPNNKNIILAAEQAKELTKAKLVVIATADVPQGIAAAIAFEAETDIATNTRSMQKAASAVLTGQVTHAVRNTEMDGFQLHDGDIIGLYHGIIAKSDNVPETTLQVIRKMFNDDISVITLYFGEGVDETQATELSAIVSDEFPDAEVMICYGGQPHYFYLISME